MLMLRRSCKHDSQSFASRVRLIGCAPPQNQFVLPPWIIYRCCTVHFLSDCAEKRFGKTIFNGCVVAHLSIQNSVLSPRPRFTTSLLSTLMFF
ncbi:hypothetical protein HanIR_Chr05g0212421 [Helianthus annuus]|nr:hypothetical protein HanIR_Chr05g0212421 [Helianthus annuus]